MPTLQSHDTYTIFNNSLQIKENQLSLEQTQSGKTEQHHLWSHEKSVSVENRKLTTETIHILPQKHVNFENLGPVAKA